MKSLNKFEKVEGHLRAYNCAVMCENVAEDCGPEAAQAYLDSLGSYKTNVLATLFLFKHRGKEQVKKELEKANG